MKFITAALASSVAALATASPLQARFATFGPSKLIADAPGTDFHGLPLQASKGRIIMGAEKQNATCGSTIQNYALFELRSRTWISLYSAEIAQILYVDVSEAGQGRIGYYTGGDGGVPGDGQTNGFTVSEDDALVWVEPGSTLVDEFQACPDTPGAKYSVWLDTFLDPAVPTKCKRLRVRIETVKNPVECIYTE